MVIGNLERPGKNQALKHQAVTQNLSNLPVEPFQPGGTTSDKAGPGVTELEQRHQGLDLSVIPQQKTGSDLERRSEAVWDQEQGGCGLDSWPTHFRPFSSQTEYHLVTHTYLQLQHSGFYWGSITMETAHGMLTKKTPGTFLIRDSCQPDVFFTLSYHADEGPTSVRVLLTNLLFSLHGSHRTFASLFALLTFYTSASNKLTLPCRRQRPEALLQICRRAVIQTHGAERIDTLPRLNDRLKDYLHAYPHCL